MSDETFRTVGVPLYTFDEHGRLTHLGEDELPKEVSGALYVFGGGDIARHTPDSESTWALRGAYRFVNRIRERNQSHFESRDD